MFDRFLRLIFPGSTKASIVQLKSREVEVKEMASGSQPHMENKYRSIPLTEVSKSAWEKLGKSMDVEIIGEIASSICEHSDGDQFNLDDLNIIKQSGEPEKMLKQVLLSWKDDGKPATLGHMEELLTKYPQIHDTTFLDLCSKFTVVTRVHFALICKARPYMPDQQ